MALLNPKDYGCIGNGAADDTVALRTALHYALLYQAGIKFSAGQYLLSDGVHANAQPGISDDNYSEQALLITGGGSSLNISVAIGQNFPSSGVFLKTASSIPYNSMTPTANATAIQSALNSSSVLGPGATAVSYDSNANWYVVQFAVSLGAPVMTASGTNLSITITVLQSGAAIVIPNAFGLQLVGEGSALADYDQASQPSPFSPASRSALVWSQNALPNGIMLHIMGCNSTLVQDLAFWGRQPAATQTARTGLLLSPNLSNTAGKQGGSGLACRSAVFTRFSSPLPPYSGSNTGTPNVSGCVQLGMNENDTACDSTSYEACAFGYGTVALLVVGSSSFNHYFHSGFMTQLAVGAYFQQGGNLQVDSLRAEAISSSNPTAFPPAVLKIGPGTQGAPYPYYGGGLNAGTFLLNNVRTNPLNAANIPVVDAQYAAAGTQVTVNGWDDTMATASEFTPAFILGAGTSVNVRHSLVNRNILAAEGTNNVPNPTTPATLRLENLIVPEHTIAAALCPGLDPNTKVDLVAERTSQYNIVRPDVATVIGRPRYSPVNFLIEQQNPKLFYDLGDLGLVAPNQGWNLYINATPPRTDGQYVGTYAQNVQGIIASDGIGGFNTLVGTGYVALVRNGFMSLGQISGQSWTLFVVVKRNVTGVVQPIVSNLGGSAAAGGFELRFDAGNHVVFLTNNGSVPYTVTSVSTFGLNAVVYIMIQVNAASSQIGLYLNGSQSTDVPPVSFTTKSYSDNGQTPFIGASGTGTTPSTISNIQIARLATFDLLVPLSAWGNVFSAGTAFQGR